MEARGEWLALGALLLPWGVLSILLPLPHMVAAFGLLVALMALIAVAIRWSRLRAQALDLDPEPWGLAAVLSLGFSMLLLLGTKGASGFERLCHDCGRLSDARTTFCHACGAFG